MINNTIFETNDGQFPDTTSLLSDSSPESILLECLFWTVLYMLYCHLASRVLRRIYRKLDFWPLAKKRGGIMCGNGQDDCVWLLVLGLHHATAGALLAVGTICNSPSIWRHGLLLENGFEVADLLAIFGGLYPYSRVDGMKTDIKVAMVLHHLPGITLSYFILNTGLHFNPHMRAIGMWLLLGAGVSCFTGCYQYTLNIHTQMKRVAALVCFNSLFFFYCRFLQFPKESWLLIRDLKSNPDHDPVLLKLLYAGFTLLTLFNTAIVLDIIPKAGRYIQRARDGVTSLETKPVPRSRDSMVGYCRKSLKMLDQIALVSSMTDEDTDNDTIMSKEDMMALQHATNCKRID